MKLNEGNGQMLKCEWFLYLKFHFISFSVCLSFETEKLSFAFMRSDMRTFFTFS